MYKFVYEYGVELMTVSVTRRLKTLVKLLEHEELWHYY